MPISGLDLPKCNTMSQTFHHKVPQSSSSNTEKSQNGLGCNGPSKIHPFYRMDRDMFSLDQITQSLVKLHWTVTVMGHPQFLWATHPRVSPLSQNKFFLIFTFFHTGPTDHQILLALLLKTGQTSESSGSWELEWHCYTPLVFLWHFTINSNMSSRCKSRSNLICKFKPQYCKSHGLLQSPSISQVPQNPRDIKKPSTLLSQNPAAVPLSSLLFVQEKT